MHSATALGIGLGRGSARPLGAVSVAALILLAACPVRAASVDEIVHETAPWLFIGTGAPNDSTTPEGKFNKGVGDAVDISNFEIGAIKAPVPANNGAPFGDGEDWGPDLVFESSVPNVPGVTIDDGPDGIVGVLPDDRLIDYSGNVAITHIDRDEPNKDKNGRFGVSNVGVFSKNESDGGTIPDGLPAGIVTAAPAHDDTSNGGSIQNNSNSFFNDPNYPNPVTSHETETGNPADKLADGNGITGDHDFSDLRMTLDGALELIPTLDGAAPEFVLLEDDNGGTYVDVLDGHTIDLTGTGGQIKGDDLIDPTNLYVKANEGLNVIDFDTGGSDLLLNNANIIVDGPEDAFVIFRVPTASKFNINQGNILIGDMGIGLWNVMFFSDRTEESAVFTFNDTIFNGIAFWTLGDASGSHINNSQGCVQYVGDKLNFQNIRYIHCHGQAVTAVPLPKSFGLGLIGLGVLAVGTWQRRRKLKAG